MISDTKGFSRGRGGHLEAWGDVRGDELNDEEELPDPSLCGEETRRVGGLTTLDSLLAANEIKPFDDEDVEATGPEVDGPERESLLDLIVLCRLCTNTIIYSEC